MSLSVIARRATSLLLATCALWAVATFPVDRWPIGLVAATAGIVTLLAPDVWSLLVPALIPLVDLTPWSGRLYFDEFDISLLAILAALLWKRPVDRQKHETADRTAIFMLGGIAASYLWGVALSLSGTFVDYLPGSGGYQNAANALRLAKPMAFAVALLAISRASGALEAATRRYFAKGCALGLGILILQVAYERWTFPGLFSFESDFRAVGPFATMHTGGASIDAYLLLAAPLLASCRPRTARVGPMIGFAALCLGTAYVLLATVTRATIAIAALQLLVLAVGMALSAGKASVRWLIGAAAALLLAGGVIGVIAAPYWRERFSTIQQDWNTRMNHWHDVLDMRGTSVSAKMFGLGLGSFRHAYLHLKEGEALPDYRIVRGDPGQHLELTGSSGIYFGQFVPVEPQTRYTLSLEVRTAPGELLSLALCEKTVLYSFRCLGNVIAGAPSDAWRRVEITLDSGELGTSKGWGRFGARPVNLAFNVSGRGAIELDNIQLIDPQGRDLMRNGNFDQGQDGWFFTADVHEPWHAKNLYLHLLVEQGWLGLALFLIPSFWAVGRLGRAAQAGQFEAWAWCCSILGFLALGIFDSLVDAPRIALQYYIMLGIVLATVRVSAPTRQTSDLTPA